ncbi:VWA domain-containing protein [Sinirhodobacter sp. WL0062]|uniref:VWA domain-containing protein n=1 Tax=Rhodobacter flavimaris TaxID=2907145 RepID=A0ABS8YRU6_9RHOB|nr:VIT domain-containing protein [Sinirhodobacter sp. WL0062]MCE5972612.1 VWA domain-containing protein [Sinirhodobacter sp. WL0062]
MFKNFRPSSASTPFDHDLGTLYDGVSAIRGGKPTPMPLKATEYRVECRRGLAIVTLTRTFQNDEDMPIEAIMTFPVGFEATVTNLELHVDKRVITAVAKSRSAARETYEEAIDRGKLAVLHEELLRGLHAVSIANLAPGAMVKLIATMVLPLAMVGGNPFLRIPVTCGQLYGNSPLLPADDLVTDANVRHAARLSVTCEDGHAVLSGTEILVNDQSVEISLKAAIELSISGGRFGVVFGRDAHGRQVRVCTTAPTQEDAALDLAVLVDRSGSTGARVGRNGLSIWESMRSGLSQAFRSLHASDRISLYQFDSSVEFLGSQPASSASRMLELLEGPRGGTELGAAISFAIANGARDILVLTDGQTWSDLVQKFSDSPARVSAVLIGSGSLDVTIGRLCAETGGQVFFTLGAEVSDSIGAALTALRSPNLRAISARTITLDDERLPARLSSARGGIQIDVEWGEPMSLEGSDPVGRFAASLALTQLDEASATQFAIRHHLCTHLTSLVLVDEESVSQDELPQMRKVPLEVSASMAKHPIHASPMVVADDEVRMCIVRSSDSQASKSGGNALFRKASAVDNRADENEAMWKAILVAFETGAPIPALSASLERKVRELEVHDAVIEIADASHIDPRIIALALVAVSLKTVPHATRFYHRVLMKLAHDQGVEFMTFWHNHLRER